MRCCVGQMDTIDPSECKMDFALSTSNAVCIPTSSEYNHTAASPSSVPPSVPTSLSHHGPRLWGPLFQKGFLDCALEAVRFLTEEEGLAADDPLVSGLRKHLEDTTSKWGQRKTIISSPATDPPSVPWHTSLGKHTVSVTEQNRKQQPGRSKFAADTYHPYRCSRPLDLQRRMRPAVSGRTELNASRSVNVEDLGPLAGAQSKTYAGSVDSSKLGLSEIESSKPNLLSSQDLEGVLSCLHYVQPTPPRVQLVGEELMPLRDHDRSQTSSEGDSIFDTSSASDGMTCDVAGEDSSLANGACCDTEDSHDVDVFVQDSSSASSDKTAAAHCCTLVSRTDCLPSSGDLPSQHVASRAECGTTAPKVEISVSAAADDGLCSEVLPPLRTLVDASAGVSFLSPEEVKIRSLAHEILTLLQEEAEDEDDDTDDFDEYSDDEHLNLDDDSDDLAVEVEP